jgi:SAM-dependent methyltransferase
MTQPELRNDESFPSLARPDGALVTLRAEQQPQLASASDWVVGSEYLTRLANSAPASVDDRVAWLGSQIAWTLRDRHDVHSNRFATTRYRDLYGTLHAHVRTKLPFELPLVGATYVDLGCGGINPLGLLTVFLALGAARGFSVDLDDVRNTSIATRSVSDVIAQMVLDPTLIAWDRQIQGAQVLKNLESFDMRLIRRGNPDGIDQRRLRFLRESVYSMSIGDAEADVVMSNAFLEHIPDVRRGVREIARITKPGGVSVHNIDMTDHRRYGGGCGPLDFLTIEGGGEIVHHCNRMRLSHFIELFESEGFEVASTHISHEVEVTDAMRTSFAKPFRDMNLDDLKAGMVVIAARRR